MATIDDARQLVTDPEYKVGIGQSAASPTIEMEADRIADVLVREYGAEDVVAARILISDAVRELGGTAGFTTLRYGMQQRELRQFQAFMPREALRE
jgi:hypothetical protein